MSSSSNPGLTPLQAVEEFIFRPTDAHIRAKSAFWTRFHENPICDPSDISLAVASRIISETRLQRWWSTPGFREWFLNANEFREWVESIAYKSLRALEEIIVDPVANANARVSAIKLMMEISRKMPTKQQEKFLDEKIQSMNKQELEEYIQKNVRLVTPATTPNK